MDDTKNILDFEQILIDQGSKKPSRLYKNVVNANKCTYKPEEVMETVYSQIKAYQMADSRSVKSKNLPAKFLCVNKMPVYNIQNPNKFDTQCISDTQLINLVEGVEAIDTNTGVTQEFDTTFAHEKICDTDIVKQILDTKVNSNTCQDLTKYTDSKITKGSEIKGIGGTDTVCDKEKVGVNTDTDYNTRDNDERSHKKSVTQEFDTSFGKHKMDTDTVSDLEENVQSQILYCKKPTDFAIEKEKCKKDEYKTDYEETHKKTNKIEDSSKDTKEKSDIRICDTEDSEINSQILNSVQREAKVLNSTKENDDIIGNTTVALFDTEDFAVYSQILPSKVKKDTKTTDFCDNTQSKDSMELDNEINTESLDEMFEVKSQILRPKAKYKSTKILVKDTKNWEENVKSQKEQMKTHNNPVKSLCNISQGKEKDFNTNKNLQNTEIDKDEEKLHIIEHLKEDDEIIKLTKLNSNSKTNSDESTSILENSNIKCLTPNNQRLLEKRTEEKYSIVSERKSTEDFNIDESQISLSPVLNVVKKRKTPSPFSVYLDTFEKFESIAMTIIEQNLDNETTKKVINSQIMGNELVLYGNGDLEGDCSPILEFKSDELTIKAQDVNKDDNEQNVIEKSSDILQDEILFSSDEELDLIHNKNDIHDKLQDLPLTLALDKSFDDVFVEENEDTMFVGFQTASNKSIQICTNSFEKAKDVIFQDDKNDKKYSFTELVEKYDAKNDNNSASDTKTNATELNFNQQIDDIPPNSRANEKNIHENNFQSVPAFQGFTTARNKKINMSNKAMERCKNIFKDIDLNEKFDSNNDLEENCEKNPNSDKKAAKVQDKEEVIDENFNDLLLQELDNIEMSLEEGRINSSLEEKVNVVEQNTSEAELIKKTPVKGHTKLVKGKEAEIIGFKTANNKNIKVSAKALADTKNIFQDIDLEDNLKFNRENPKEIEEKVINKQLASKSPARFKTSRLQKIFENVQKSNKDKDDFEKQTLKSGKTPEKSNKLFDINTNILKEKGNVHGTVDDQQNINNTGFVGFKTANNKIIKISETALFKTNAVFKDIDKISPKSIKSNEEDYSKPATSKAYTTDNAKNKSDDIYDTPRKRQKSSSKKSNCSNELTEEALLKIERLFKDIDNNIVQKTKKIKSNKNNIEETNKNQAYGESNTEPNVFIGFQTASKKAVKISEHALAKSRKIFDEFDNENTQEYTNKAKENLEKANRKESLSSNEKSDDTTAHFVGFKTASNKDVKISAEALTKSKEIFHNVDIIEENEKLHKNLLDNAFKGFQTASKKNVEVSNEALLKSRKLFENIDFIDKNDQNLDKIVPKCGFKGFQTASNKNVKISDEALAKTKKNFENIDVAEENGQQIDKIICTDNVFRGFQTASNKNVAISEESLAKTKKIFENIELETEDENKTNIKMGTSFKGFQTANKQNVKISKEAIEKTKNIFNDIEFTKNDEDFEINTKKRDTKTFDTKHNSAKVTQFEQDFNKIPKENTSKTNSKETNKESKDIENIINTQVLNHFETTINTEEFYEKPNLKPNKRSGSPILSCPKAKKKKFETPYITQAKKVINFDKEDEIPTKSKFLIFQENYKKDKKYTLKDLNFEIDKTKIVPYILNFNLDNILNFEFYNQRNDLTESILTIEDVKKIFTESTNKKFIPEGWLENHLKLILWKLLSYEVNFPNLGICTVNKVMDQLKYRYDKELYNAERPILRKILEKDDVSTNTIVFCVAGIIENGVSVASVTNQTNIELLLTDGWYFIKATIDKMLSKLVYDKKIYIGCKIVTEGAELVNCEQGVSPWEDTSAIRLNISGNSTRRVAWDTKLGLRPFRLRSTLATVKPEGGKIRRLLTFVTRLYPLLYVEKFEDGSTVTRSERLEHIYQNKYEAEREVMIEKIYEQVEKEFCQESQDSEESVGSNKRKAYESGSQIAKMMKKSKDPMEFRAQLTTSQIQNLQEHTNRQRDKLIQEIQDRVSCLGTRHYVTLSRVRILHIVRDGDNVQLTKGMLSVWKPNDAVLEILKEGNWIEVMNVVPTGVRNSEIQISAGRQSVFRKVTKEDKLFDPYLATLQRKCFNIKDLSQNPSMATEFNEIDTVGFIFSIEPTYQEFESDKTQFQNVYLADIDKNMICVNFWGGIKKFGYENVLDTGQVLFCANLQKRSGNTRRNVPQYRATEFSTFTKSSKNVKGRELVEEFNKKMFGLDRRRFCEDCVAIKQNYSVIKCFDTENVSPYRFHNNSAYNLGKHKMLIETPKNVKKDEFDLSGLDFESTFKQDTQFSPKTLLRKKQVQEKIAKLKMYGEPPPLSPMSLINISKNAANCYKSPLASTSVVTSKSMTENLNVATPTKLPDVNAISSKSSPIISMNRTYVKRANPVKLNFEKDNNESVDHFAEEFEGSPPLSLE